MVSKWMSEITDSMIEDQIKGIKSRQIIHHRRRGFKQEWQELLDKMPPPSVSDVRGVLEKGDINETSPLHEIRAAIAVTLVPDKLPGWIVVGIEFDDEE